MSNLEQWLALTGYRVTEGGEYGWQCYGANAWFLSATPARDKHVNLTVVHREGQVCELTAIDFPRGLAYRWQPESLRQVYRSECQVRGVDPCLAMGDLNYVDLDVIEDYWLKASAIWQGKTVDRRVQVPVELDDRELLQLMTMAHERDITFNEFVGQILEQAMEQLERDAAAGQSLTK